ncbi:MAG: amidohydrolase family protein, partial [Thermodesulfobacteriota bacterium]
MSNKILSAETILPVQSEPLFSSSVALSEGTIVDIGPRDTIRRKYADFSETDLGMGILLPGFINGHVHLELGWIKNEIGNFNNFTQWLNQIINSKADEKVTDELIKQSVKDGISTLVKSGVTTVGEISSYGGLDKGLIKDSGLRAIIFEELFDRHIDLIDEMEYVREGIIENRPFPHAPYSCSPELLTKIFGLSVKSGTAMGIHLAESEDEKLFVKNEANNIEDHIYPLIKKDRYKRPVADSPFDYIRKYDTGLKSRLTIIHAVHVSDEEIDEINEKNIGVILCPRSNQYLKVGTPPLAKLTELKGLGLA